MEPLHPKFLIFYAYLFSVLYVHFRGRVRHPLYRDFTDYCNLFAPYNALVYCFSAVPNRPLVDVAHFPELTAVTDNWETIRDEALILYKAGKAPAWWLSEYARVHLGYRVCAAACRQLVFLGGPW